MRYVLVAFLLSASQAFGQNAPSQEGAITCFSPVSPNDSARSLIQRYGQEAEIRDGLYTGIEDITYKGVVLLPHAADWRIDVSFADETLERVASLTVRDTNTSHWNIAGVRIGSSLAEVQKINGGPFLVTGWDSDFAGFVADWKGGKLVRSLPGGCRVSLRFGKDGDTPVAKNASSDNAALIKWGPVVTQINVNFPDK